MALNFWHSDGKIFGFEELWRRPNAMHRRFYGLIKSLVRSDGLDAEFEALRSGRKNPELFPRLFDLVECFKLRGVYDRSFQSFEVPRNEPRYPELQPYRDLDPSRLKVSGKAQWDVSEFLSGNFLMILMAHREAMILKLDRAPEPWEFARLRDDQETIHLLARLWDSNGLLYIILLHQQETERREEFEKVRVLNAYKNESTDRQISDRCGRHAIEAVIKGPCSHPFRFRPL